MALTSDEKAYFDERFKRIDEKIDVALTYGPEITNLKIQMQKRPTTVQVLMACSFFLGLGITLGAAII